MKTFTVQFKFQPEARAKVCGIRAETAAQAIAEAARDLRLTPYDVGDPVNDTADYSAILEAIDTTPASAAQPLTRSDMESLIAAIVRMEHKGGYMTQKEYTAAASLCAAAEAPQFFADYFANKAQPATKTVSGYWIDRPQEIRHGLRVYLSAWDRSEEDDGNSYHFYTGEPIYIGRRIGNFVITHIED